MVADLKPFNSGVTILNVPSDRSQLGVNMDKTHLEHNESALNPIADVGADIDFRR